MPAVKGDGMPAVKGDGMPAVKGDGMPAVKGDGMPAVKGDCMPAVKGDCMPAVKGDGMPAVKGDCMPAVKGDGMPAVKGDCMPAVKGDCMPAVKGDGMPAVKGDGMPAVKGDCMRGLAVFISDIRNCKSKEAELTRINKELSHIRSKFKGDKTLDGYQKKNYVCKLLFIFLLGYDIDFGHMEAVNLLSSNKYTEKQIGYLFISVLGEQNSDLMKLIIQAIKNDLVSRNPVHVKLALEVVANIESGEIIEEFCPDLTRLLDSDDFSTRQSAALCLVNLNMFTVNDVERRETAVRLYPLADPQLAAKATALALLPMFTPMQIKSETIFSRLWNELSKEAQKDFPAKLSMERKSIQYMISILGCMLLDDVDPNPEKYVSAGVTQVFEKSLIIFRIEPNSQAKMYRLTIRSSKDTVSKTFLNLISALF